MNKTNKVAHGIVLAFFAIACWFVWVVLQLPMMVQMRGVALQIPAYTRLCIALGTWIVIGMAILATAYCVRVWLLKAERQSSWVAFLAAATGSLLFVTLPSIVAIYLPLVNALQHVAIK